MFATFQNETKPIALRLDYARTSRVLRAAIDDEDDETATESFPFHMANVRYQDWQCILKLLDHARGMHSVLPENWASVLNEETDLRWVAAYLPTPKAVAQALAVVHYLAMDELYAWLLRYYSSMHFGQDAKTRAQEAERSTAATNRKRTNLAVCAVDASRIRRQRLMLNT
jgi:hypothetical protein